MNASSSTISIMAIKTPPWPLKSFPTSRLGGAFLRQVKLRKLPRAIQALDPTESRVIGRYMQRHHRQEVIRYMNAIAEGKRNIEETVGLTKDAVKKIVDKA